MIEYAQGDLLQCDAQALVNTVNCVGVMGKGIALQFKRAFPANTRRYLEACKAGELEPGRVLMVEVEPPSGQINPRLIVNFPTKDHWKSASKLEWIERGLENLIEEIKARQIESIAVPPLGCGNGGLDWKVVRPIIERAFEQVPHVRVLLFSPEGAPAPEAMKRDTKAPNMSLANALYVQLIEDYRVFEWNFSELELQKLSYFLQEAGEPLELNFAKERYGPYAPEVRHVLKRWEGHWLHGYGDGTGGARKAMTLDEAVLPLAHEWLTDTPATTHDRLGRVSKLIEGFESAYGLELLSTVHWVATRQDKQAATDVNRAIVGVQDWSAYKRDTFPPDHIKIVWQHLRDSGWIGDSEDEPTDWETAFQLENPMQVHATIGQNLEMQKLLLNLASQLNALFSGETLALRVVPDPDVIGQTELVLAVQTRRSSSEGLALLEKFEAEFWAHTPELASQLLLTLDFLAD